MKSKESATLGLPATAHPLLSSRRAVGSVGLDAEGADYVQLSRLLRQLNHRVLVAEAGDVPAAGLQRAIVATVVSDAIERPLERCRALAGECPVILVSDDMSFTFRIAAARAGVSALIQRPVSPTELSEWLGYLAGRDASAQISVLIVDDDRLGSEINAEVLRSAGMSVTVTNDPTLAFTTIEEFTPDIVLMDLCMPVIDGVELARIIRQSMRFISLPIVFLSVEQNEERQLVARRFGGDDFIIKPVPPARLVSLVKMRAERSKVLRALIERDRMTGLLDHTRFKERLAQELERCRRSGAEISLAMIDIDFFKRVNDHHGHLAGDDVLRALADLIIAGLRRIDIAGRCGGEEFGIIMLDTAPADAAAVVATMNDRFKSAAFQGSTRSFVLSFSAGIASSRQSDTTASLMAAADAALYKAKRAGRDRVRVAGQN